MRDIIGYDVVLGADIADRAVRLNHPTVKRGIELGNFMADPKYKLAYIEDLIHCTRFNAVNLNKQITESSRTATLNGEDIFGLDNFRPWIELNAIDIIHPDLLTAGGMIETKKIADYAHLFGIKTMMHNASSPIGVMANVHTAATIKEFISLECHTMEMPWVEDLVTGIPKPIIQNGVITVPDSPGLGIEFIDEVAEKYLREPEYLAYKSGLFNPTPEFDKRMTMMEAKEKGVIGDRQDHGGPWWHIGDDGKLEYTAGSK
jgi:L-alanine-DL-glutamate epimerase-like enolase superfamily enzyme